MAAKLRAFIAAALQGLAGGPPSHPPPPAAAATIVVQCPHPPSQPPPPQPGKGRFAIVLGAGAVIAAVASLWAQGLSPWWFGATATVVVGSSITALILFKRYWSELDARLEAAIAAAGVALAVVLLATQVGVDNKRATADARRDLLLSIGQSESLRGVSYTDVELPAANLIDRDLRDAQLVNVTMNQASMSRVLADGASFTGLRGDNIDFSGGSFQRVSFKNANLTNANFAGADLGAADLTGFRCDRCRFNGASLQSVIFDETTDFARSVADHNTTWPVGADIASLKVLAPGQNLAGIRLADYDLNLLTDSAAGDKVEYLFQDTQFRDADLGGIDLTRFVIDGSQLQGADLSGAVFGDRRPDRIVVNSVTKIDRSKLAQFVDVDEPNLVLSFPVDLSDETLEGLSVAPEKSIAGSSFAGSTISNSDLSGTSMAVTFEDATLINVKLAGSTLDGANLKGANLTDVGLDGLKAAVRNTVDGASLTITIYDEATRWPDGYVGHTPPSADEIEAALDAFDASNKTEADQLAVNAVVYRGYGWVDASNTIDLRHPVVIAQPDRLREIQQHGFYRPNLMNWIVKGIDFSGPEGSVATTIATNIVNFQGEGSLFKNRSFDESNLYICDLRQADLRGASFRRTNLSGCNLSTAIMSPADGSTDQFGSTQYAGMVFDARTRFPRGFEIPPDAIRLEGSIAGQNLSRIDISGNLLPRIDATGASFDNALIYSSTFAASDFTGATFINASAHGVVLSGAVSMRGADLTDADFSGATMKAVDLRQAIAHRTNFMTATLTNADLSGASLIGADFTGASLDGADFSGTDLTDAIIDPGALAKARTDDHTQLPATYREDG